jgi:glucose/arabinose dehydrogenase
MTRSRAVIPVLVAVALGACGSEGATDRAAGSTTTPSASTATTGTGGGTTTAPKARSAQVPRGVRLLKVGTFTAPTYVTSPPGDKDRLMVVEQAGRIMVIRDGVTLPEPFLDIRDRVTAGGEQGLLSVAFPPDYARTGRFYVYFTGGGGADNRIVEFRRRTRDVADPATARTVLRMPNVEPNHNGGLMLFGPDGNMYVGTGDGGGANDQHGKRGNAQNLRTLLGKLLRIDPRPSGGRPYRVPVSNPFVGRADARGEIWSYGLRNPWRFSFDSRNGNLIIGDVGQEQVEEIDFAPNGSSRGANYGWRPFEGDRVNFNEPAPGAVAPVITHTHAEGFCSITGGYVVRDSRLPELVGRYVYADLCEGRIRAATLRAGQKTTGQPLKLHNVPAVSSFGEDARGRVYVVSLSGPVYRLAPVAAP